MKTKSVNIETKQTGKALGWAYKTWIMALVILGFMDLETAKGKISRFLWRHIYFRVGGGPWRRYKP